MRKLSFNKNTITNGILLSLLAVILFVPDAKSVLIRGLMSVGFFKPATSTMMGKAIKSDIKFQNGNGELIHLSDLRGKVIFLNFWATWCPPCRAEMPSINTLYNQLSSNKNIVFITVDADGQYNKAKKFLDKKKYSLPLYTIASDIPSDVYAGKLPTTLVINKMGEIVFKHEGTANYADPGFSDLLVQLSEE